MRADWKAIKVVYNETGLKAARIWAETPLLDTEEISRFLSPRSDCRIEAGKLMNLPLSPVVIRLELHPDAGNRIACCIQEMDMNDDRYDVVAMTIVSELSMSEVKEIRRTYGHDGHFSATVFYERNRGRLSEWSGGKAVPTWSYMASDATVSKIIDIFDYINNSSKHAVEVIQLTNDGKPMRARHTTKPWTREDLRNVILIDPSEAKKYGHRIDRGGTHASPIPHTRRGHYATLRSDRFGVNKGKRIWRKPAWVGDTEWIFEGRQYKVISPEAMRGGAM
jgi:hypothetical protein